MNVIFKALPLLFLAGSAVADVQLQSLHCSSKDLTLTAAIAQESTSADESKPNAKGHLYLQASTAHGRQLLGGHSYSESVDLSVEFWPKGFFVVSFLNDKAQLNINDASDLGSAALGRSLFVYKRQVSSLEDEAQVIFDAAVSSIKGQSVHWKNCEFDDLTLNLKSITPSQLEEASHCSVGSPQNPSSTGIEPEAIRDMILQQGPSIKKVSDLGLCFQKYLIQQSGPDVLKSSDQEIQDLISMLMTSTIKAEVGERGLGVDGETR